MHLCGMLKLIFSDAVGTATICKNLEHFTKKDENDILKNILIKF